MKSFAVVLMAVVAPLAWAQAATLTLDPARTQVEFTLGAVLHTVHGSFALKRGSIHYDFATGKCSGEIAIDARSGNSAEDGRDKKMNKSVLESEKYPEIVFVADGVTGSVAKANVHGVFRIHGQDHEMTLVMTTAPGANGLEVSTQFVVPYVQWGMSDPSTLILRVGKTVTIDVRGVGRVQ